MKEKKIGGLMTALITPFDGAGRFDAEAMAKLVRFQISKGTDGLYPCGSTGLGPMLRVEERKRVAETVVGEAAGKVPVVVQVGAADTQASVELAKHAEKVGADAVASLTPYYYKPGEQAVVKHFESVSRAVSIRFLAYNIPQFTGNNLLPATVAKLAKDGVIAGIKDSSRDFLQLVDLLEMVPEEFIVMNGTEEYGLFAIMAGADGLVSGGANAFPEIFKDLVSTEKKEDHGAALKAQERVQKVKEIVKAGPISSYYAVLRERGIDCGAPRAPMLPVENERMGTMFSDLRKVKAIPG